MARGGDYLPLGDSVTMVLNLVFPFALVWHRVP